MEDYIIIAIIIILLALGITATISHFKRKSGCCGGGGSYKLKKKKLSKVIYKKTLKVEGMHCERCKARVEEIVGDIKGVAGSVDLKKGELTVSYEEDMSDELIRSRIERAGYKVL